VSSGNHPGSAGAPGGGENSSSRKKERLNRRLPQPGKEPVNSKRGQQKLSRLSPDLKKTKQNKTKKRKKNGASIQEPWNDIKQSNTHVIRVPER
jgi:hypothetical protein